MFALVDCNNFYASCERVFRPDLTTTPIIILSNNDGCVIARSNETQALGIKMGEPYFKIKAFCRQHKIQVFSSNYTLYGDFSERVMSVIQAYWPDMEIYSIDEAFLDLSTMPLHLIDDFCTKLRNRIFQCTGIPTSIGIGETKTLSKVASFIAKKKLAIPVFNIINKKHWLQQIEVTDIWGIGRQWSKKLNALNIFTAHDLAHTHFSLLKKNFNVVLLRTAMELNDQICLEPAEWQAKKSIVSSCSFGELQTSLCALKEAVSYHCATAWSKMRKQKSSTQYLSVFIHSNSFRTDLPQHSNSASFKLIQPCDDIRSLTRYSIHCLESIYKEGFHYKKCGVLLTDLTDNSWKQQDLFSVISKEEQQNSERVMHVMEQINSKFGARTMYLAAEGVTKKWSMKREIKTPCYTTNWAEIPVVYAR
ncbi:MAG: Y-family DNA polymerase [Legionellaceae bacterium]|nr:Y-family DNA polymerase [Legionellaceae bacterium]